MWYLFYSNFKYVKNHFSLESSVVLWGNISSPLFLNFWHFNHLMADKKGIFLPCKRKNNRFIFHFRWFDFTSESKTCYPIFKIYFWLLLQLHIIDLMGLADKMHYWFIIYQISLCKAFYVCYACRTVWVFICAWESIFRWRCDVSRWFAAVIHQAIYVWHFC